ncbi:MAG: hypothetical protein AAGB34_07930 [Planctomycetota bacterium]
MKTQKDLKPLSFAVTASAICTTPALAATTTFDNGTEGWAIHARETISETDGHPGANLHVVMSEVWGLNIYNDTNPDFTGDLSRYGQMEFSIDIKLNRYVHSVLGHPMHDVFGIELQQILPGNVFASVFVPIGRLDGRIDNDWTTYSFVLDDPFATELPPGWIGSGALDSETGTIPMLPEGSTFASVLQNVDRLSFVTAEPGYLSFLSTWDIQVDNITLRSVPAPGTAGALALLGFAATRRRR